MYATDLTQTFANSPNAPALEAWNTFLAPKFTRFRWQLVTGAAAHADRLLAQLDIPRGARVLDIGCGFGETCLQLSERVGPAGHVSGFDCGESFLEVGRADIEKAGVTNVDLRMADVEIADLGDNYDLCFSRFGTMFFDSPVLAMRNARASLRPGAELATTVWRTIDDNPFLGLGKIVALEYLPPPGPDAATCGPGPFSMANPLRLRSALHHAGFEDVTLERSDVDYNCGRTLEEAIDFMVTIGAAGEIIREARDEGRLALPLIRERLARILAPSVREDGVYVDSSAWLVRARNPG